jgi:predicted transcriptional regulator
MKLVKIQLDILEDAVASEAKNGVRKTIHVRNFNNLDGFSQRYQEYCNRMEMLINAGFISRDINPNDGYAYITIKGENFINGVTY